MRIDTIDELIADFSRKVANQDVEDRSWVSIPVVTDDKVKTHVGLVSVEMIGNKAVFVGGVASKEMTLDELEDRLHELEIEHGDAECYSKYDEGDILVPIYDAYLYGRKHASFRVDYSEFDKTDEKISRDVVFRSDYMNKTDAVKAMWHVIHPMGMEFDCPKAAIKFKKISPNRSEVSARVSGTATAIYDFKNGSYFIPDKKSYEAARIKW